MKKQAKSHIKFGLALLGLALLGYPVKLIMSVLGKATDLLAKAMTAVSKAAASINKRVDALKAKALKLRP